MDLYIKKGRLRNSISWGMVIILIVFSLSACRKKDEGVKGFLWEVKKGESTVYLYGSIHVGKSDLYPLNETVEKAFEESSILGLEVNILDIISSQDSMRKYAYYEDDDDVFNHISEKGKEKLLTVAEEAGIVLEPFKNLKPSALGSLVSSIQLQRAGYNPQDGIDYYFAYKAFKEGKKIVELESYEFQAKLLYNDFTEEEQEEYFIMSLTSQEETRESLDELYRMFIKGDEEGISKAVLEGDRESNYHNKLITQRNINMASKIEEFLDSGETCFIVVGLGHYLSEDSVVSLLKQRGYEVTRK